MDTKDTAETTEPSLAPAKPPPEPSYSKEKEELLDLSGMEVAFSELRVGTIEGKEKEKWKP